MLIKCNRLTSPNMPLKAYEDIENYKIYLSDVGLLNSLAKINYKSILENQDFIFKGALTENYIAQNLSSKKYNLYYWRSDYDAKVDFILQKEEIIPIEVKSSENTKSKSLNIYIDKFKPTYSVSISLKNFGFTNNIFSIPLYAIHLL